MQLERNGTDCACVGGYVVAMCPVATCHGTDKMSVLINERDSRSVEFQFANYCELLAIQGISDTGEPFVDVVDGICVCQRQHRVYVIHLAESFGDVGTDTQGGGVGIVAFGVLGLELFEAFEQGIVLPVGYLRGVEHVVVVVVPMELAAQTFNQFDVVIHQSDYLIDASFGIALEFYIALGRGGVFGISPECAGNHEVGTGTVAGDGYVVKAALAQQHLYVGLMRLCVEIVDEEHGQIHLMAYYKSRYFRIAAHGAGVHALDIGAYTGGVESLSDQPSGCAGTYQFVPAQIFGVVFCPIDHVGLAVVVCYECYSEFFFHDSVML